MDSKIVGEVFILVNCIVCSTIPSVPKCIFLSCKCWKSICENGKHNMKCFTKTWRKNKCIITQITSIVTIVQSSSLNASNIFCNKLVVSRLQRSWARLLNRIVTMFQLILVHLTSCGACDINPLEFYQRCCVINILLCTRHN